MSDGQIKAFQFIEGGARYGAAVSIMNIAEGMRRCDVDVDFGVFAGRPLGEVLRERGFRVHDINANKRYDFKAIRQLVKLFKSERYDVVHTHLSKATINGAIAARLARVPVVSTVHGMNKKYTYMMSTHIMTVSEAAKQYLVNQGVSPARVTAVYNCIPMEPFLKLPDKERAKQAFGFDPQAVVLGTVSRAHQQKGIEIAIGAVAELRKRGYDAKYLFLGDGPHLDQFKTLVGTLGLAEHVKFPGFSDDIGEPLAAMDAFLFPTFREAFGISLLEAMAARVPIVASNVDGVPEVLAEGSGVLVDDRSPEAFATATESLLQDSAARQAVINKARRRVETVFSVEETAKNVENVYRRAIREGATSLKRRFRNAT